MDRRKRTSRPAFTLIELLMVILIIGTLIGLLVPAVIAAIRKAKEAQVTAEMNNLASALASYKNLYGDYPPSRVLLCENGYTAFQTNYASMLTTAVGPTTNGLATSPVDSDITYAQLLSRSYTYLSRIWSRVDFNGASNGAGGFGLDFNGDGVIETTPIILSGSECLTFFLGGVPIHSGSTVTGLSGFSKSPVNPFPLVVVGTPPSPNRTVPLYEFVAGRLIDQDGDGFPSYIDPINVTAGSRRAYAYFSSYGSNGYDPNDVNGYGHTFDQNTASPNDAADFETDETTGLFTTWGFQVTFPTTLANGNYYAAVSPAPNPYTSGPSATGNVAWINPTTFQILCAGQDGLWGMGGTYSATAGTSGTLPLYPNDPGNVNSNTNRSPENDNLTNFATSRLN